MIRSVKQIAEEDHRPIGDVLDEIIAAEPLEPRAELDPTELRAMFDEGRLLSNTQRRVKPRVSLEERAAVKEKACVTCKRVLPMCQFDAKGNGRGYYRSQCKGCLRAYYREYSRRRANEKKSRAKNAEADCALVSQPMGGRDLGMGG